MTDFLAKHRIIRIILDWVVFLGSMIFLVAILTMNVFDLAWKVPILIMLWLLLVMFYVQHVHEKPEDRFTSIEEYASFLNVCNAILFVIHLFIGIRGRYSSNAISPSLLRMQPVDAMKVASVYILIALVMTTITLVKKRKKSK